MCIQYNFLMTFKKNKYGTDIQNQRGTWNYALLLQLIIYAIINHYVDQHFGTFF